MILGVSGTRSCPSEHQTHFLYIAITSPAIIEVHHGDCVGLDNWAHNIAASHRKLIVVHPPDVPKWRAYCTSNNAIVLPTRWYTNRNLDIVLASDICVAFPYSREWSQSKGTYNFIDHATKHKKPLIIVHADGGLERANCDETTPF